MTIKYRRFVFPSTFDATQRNGSIITNCGVIAHKDTQKFCHFICFNKLNGNWLKSYHSCSLWQLESNLIHPRRAEKIFLTNQE